MDLNQGHNNFIYRYWKYLISNMKTLTRVSMVWAINGFHGVRTSVLVRRVTVIVRFMMG